MKNFIGLVFGGNIETFSKTFTKNIESTNEGIKLASEKIDTEVKDFAREKSNESHKKFLEFSVNQSIISIGDEPKTMVRVVTFLIITNPSD